MAQRVEIASSSDSQIRSSRAQLAVRPHDWMNRIQLPVGGDDALSVAHDLFRRRTGFGFPTDQSLRELKAAQTLALQFGPTSSELHYEHAFVLLQHRPSLYSLRLAQLALQSAAEDGLGDSRVDRLSTVLNRSVTNDRPPHSRFDRVNRAINNECPQTCPGCYNNFSPNQLGISEALEILQWLVQSGVHRLIISGGDPLLWEDLPRFLKACGRLNVLVGLDTTGYSLEDDDLRMIESAPIAYVGIPIDAPDDDRQHMLRFSRTRDLVSRSMTAVGRLGALGIPVKVNTSISATNRDWIAEVAELIVSTSVRPRFWSLFQWSPLRADRQMRDHMQIPDLQFRTAVRIAEVLTSTVPGRSWANAGFPRYVTSIHQQ